MTTPTEIREDFRQFRQENRDDHQKIIDRLNHINGTVRRHDVEIAKMAEVQNGHNKTLDRLESSLKAAWKRVQALDMSNVKMGVMMSVAFGAAFALLQYLVFPLIKHLLNGG